MSVDISEKNVAFAKSKVSKSTQIICRDSLSLLCSITEMRQPIDLLYLDSLDYYGSATECGISALHHCAELCLAWKWLAHDALIAIDDCITAYEGKHAMVKAWFDAIGVKPLVDDYIHVWRKPSPRPITL